MKRFFLAFVYIIISAPIALAQDTTDVSKVQRLINWFNNSSYVVAPVVSYQPETSWQFGIGAKYLFRPQKYDTTDTRKSFFAAGFNYSLKNQILITPALVIFTNHENFLFDGNYVYKKFPQNYFGIGNNSLSGNKELVDLQELRLEQIIFKKVKNKFFAGGGFRYVNIYDVRQKSDGLLVQDKPIGWDGFVSIGLTLNARLDNRDNVLNAYHGSFIDASATFMQLSGSAGSSYSLYELDARKYIKPFEHRNDVIAGQFSMMSAPKGDVPFTEMPFLGSGSLMRGYYGRRYIDRFFIGGQVEYRLSLPHNFGLVGFAGIGDVSERFGNIRLDQLKYSIGTGIRYKIIPKENINVRFDIGFGNGSTAFYVDIAEAF